MQNETQNLLPKMMPGTIHAQYVRCGKPNCRCVRGELHGVYYYHFVRVGGKLRKRYLKSFEFEETQKACLLRQSYEKEQRDDNKTVWKLLRELRASLREIRNPSA